MFTINLGSEVKSQVTNFVGIVTARSENLYGCNRYYINPPAGKDGKLVDGCWFDEDDLKVLKESKVKSTLKKTGGPISRVK